MPSPTAAIRPMRPDDVAEAEQVSSESLHALDRLTLPRAWPEPEPRQGGRSRSWQARTQHLLRTDPGGCWVAEEDGTMVGVVTSLVREGTWILSTYAVRPGHQGRGVGKPLLAAALHHGRGALRGMLSSSADPRAVRVYRQAGLSLHPQMVLRGTLDRTAIPLGTGDKVREGSAGDQDLLDSVDRQARGSAHGADHPLLMTQSRLLVSETSTGSGYAYAYPDGRVALLAATNRRTAGRLLWSALADGPEQTEVAHVTAANEWALDIGLAARLEVWTVGYLALRAMRPPSPYLHHGSLL
ncbi:GNAT superfamily N-acetyltransferase [Nocardioides salarius]|uniref:GNAT superfamily N-acetyltransferase n=1 Tax=Nocardioides salarius TaxID=374513 RepID=A0ABS2M6N5_9ACTN|nr:GNAT family N-acetyltransferase [Nocardioides salarius]MBM7506806.1 GNAT superfamily N-acetyltransferase [Nocardioides salarius]